MSRSRAHPHSKGERGKTSGETGGGGGTKDDEWWTIVVYRDAGMRDGIQRRSGLETGVGSMFQGAESARDDPGKARDPATDVGKQVDQWRLQ